MLDMRKKISFVVLNHTGSSAKQATVSQAILIGIGFFLLFSLVLLGWLGHDYFSLRKTVHHIRAIEKNMVQAQAEIITQREQIQQFAGTIDALKVKLADLNGFEKKIRIIANLENESDDTESLFGVGGSLPEDLDPQLEIEASHQSLIREMHEQVQQLDQVAHHQHDRFETLYQHLESQRNLLAATPAIRPVDGWVASRFGYRNSPFTDRREFHKGLDIAAKKGSPIWATADGVVTFAGKKGLLGLTIIINHGHGVVTRYGHARKLLKKRGDKVKRGDIIAEVGNSGRSTGPHVHYEVKLNGVTVNPAKYILN